MHHKLFCWEKIPIYTNQERDRLIQQLFLQIHMYLNTEYISQKEQIFGKKISILNFCHLVCI
jgi:hypothetical protein